MHKYNSWERPYTLKTKGPPRFCISLDPKGGWVLIIGILEMSGKELKSQ
jgi:hypothetical protein